MRGNELLDKMSLIDPAFIEAAEVPRKRRKTPWLKWGVAAAACIALAAFAGTKLFPQGETGRTLDLPMLSLSTIQGSNAAMGYEGYLAYDIADLVNANPWNENTVLTTLPVYQNPLTYDDVYTMIASGADFDAMRSLALDVAGRLGLDPDQVTVSDNAPGEEERQKITEKMESVGDTVPDGYFDPTAVTVEADGIKIEVDQIQTATIYFDPAISLPEEYNFTHYASYDETAAVAEYLKGQYQDLIGIDNPQLNLCGGDYNIYGQEKYDIAFFDAAGSETEQIIQYNFNQVTFACNDEGKLFLARVYRPDLSEKMGDYPIISPEQAKDLLIHGSYITSVPYEMPGEAYIRKVELVYRTGQYDAYFLPYYRFYVELPEEKLENGLRDYGAYYVPAVESAYLSNMPVWDGSFN